MGQEGGRVTKKPESIVEIIGNNAAGLKGKVDSYKNLLNVFISHRKDVFYSSFQLVKYCFLYLMLKMKIK